MISETPPTPKHKFSSLAASDKTLRDDRLLRYEKEPGSGSIVNVEGPAGCDSQGSRLASRKETLIKDVNGSLSRLG